MRLNNKFNVSEGWPREGAIAISLPIHQSGGVYDVLSTGAVVTVGTDGAFVATSTPNRSTTDAVATWVVVEGNTDYSGAYVGKAVALRGNAIFTLDPANYNAGTYTPGTKLTFSAGKWQPAVTNNQIIGEVLSDNQATDQTITVFYTGGDAAAK